MTKALLSDAIDDYPWLPEPPETECLLWEGTVNRSGYATMYAAGKTRQVHRIMYEAMVGPIPEGYQIDHLCRVRHCINPDHLEAVAPRENTLRGTSVQAQNARKTHCKHGHEFTPENTKWYQQKGFNRPARRCRACMLRIQRQRRGSKRTKLSAEEKQHILELLDSGLNQYEVAAIVGRHQATVWRVANARTS